VNLVGALGDRALPRHSCSLRSEADNRTANAQAPLGWLPFVISFQVRVLFE
jgi:hypothetical protein